MAEYSVREINNRFKNLDIVEDDLQEIKKTNGYGKFQLLIKIMAKRIVEKSDESLGFDTKKYIDVVIKFVKERM